MKLVLLGGPGAGKGTQSKILAKHYNVTHISTGDILREHMKNETDIGLDIKDIMDAGNLVSDQIVTQLLKARIQQPDCKKGFVLDGYPRTLYQAEILTQVVGEVDNIVLIDVEDSLVIERMGGRYTCPNCSAMYHVKYNPPKEANVCNECGHQLTQRDDDRVRTVENRLKVYHQLTEPIIHYFNDKGMLVTVHGVGEIGDITNRIIAEVS